MMFDLEIMNGGSRGAGNASDLEHRELADVEQQIDQGFLV